MKKIIIICAALLMTASVFAQSPEKMSYQAVVRDGSNALVTSTAVGMQISILQGSASGTAVYVETQTPTSNANGLVSLEIGAGTVVSGTFASINWATGPYFIKTETDPTGGTSYTITGTSQLLSVPYALHAKTAETVTGTITETDPVFGASVASGITGTDTTNWNNKLDTEVDGSITNEIQALSISNDTVYLSNGGFVKLPAGFDGQYSSLTGTPTNVSSFTNDAGYLTTFTEVDGSVTNEIQALSISNDTIYLSNGGFVKLPAETDPIYGASVASGITGTDTTNWNNKLDSYTETDPVYGASVAAGITGADTTNWNNKWGLTGNTGTTVGTNFLGTTDAQDFAISTNNTERIRVQSGGNVGIGTTGPAAILDVTSTTGGVLLPRMTTAQRNAIVSPANALLIFNTTTECFEAYRAASTTWVAFGCIGCAPTTANAGLDINPACGVTTATLAGNTPTVGTGNWTVISGTATITTPSSPTSGVTGLAVPGTATLRWTISNSPCADSFDEVVITTTSCFTCGSPFTDARDGKSYNTVLIGSQCWMSENLAYLPSVVGPATGDGTTPYYYVYGYTGTDVPTAKATANYATYGVLYNWPAFMNGSASCNGTAPPPDANVKCSPVVQGACPAGWHVPSHYEWTLLEKNVGSNPGAFPYDVTTSGVWLGTDEGGNLKETGTTHWTTPNTGATNSSGLTALPGGYRSTGGTFSDVGNYGYWWSATEFGTNAWYRTLSYTEARVNRNNLGKAYGWSCRCVKD